MGMDSYIIVHNVAKRHNIGTMVRSATAFGVSALILVGRKDFNAFGSHGSTPHLQLHHFHTLLEARLYLKDKDCDICGVEIVDGAIAIHDHPFRKSTAFLLVWAGFSERQRDGQKFVVAETQLRQVRRNVYTEPIEIIVKERKAKKEVASYDWLDDVTTVKGEGFKERFEVSSSCTLENDNQSSPLSMLFEP